MKSDTVKQVEEDSLERDEEEEAQAEEGTARAAPTSGFARKRSATRQ